MEIVIIISLAVALMGALVLILSQTQQIADKDRLVQSLEDKARLLEAIEHIEADKDRELADLRVQIAAGAQEAESIADKLSDVKEELEALKERSIYERALTLTLANVAYGALIVVDSEGKIIAINDTAEELFQSDRPIGQSLEEVTQLPDLALMVSDALNNEEENFENQIIFHEQNYRVRSQVIKRDGHLFIGLAMQDITQLVRLNRARRDMVANISHELRTPIANIRLIIDSLFHEQDKPRRKDSIHSLRAIAQETDNLLWLVQEMSDLSMIESGQAIVRMVENPLIELVDAAMERLADQSEKQEVRVVQHVPENLQVLCDRDLINRVLVNLIHNALKWSPKGETVTVSTMQSEDEVTVQVMDNGPGVPADAVDRIFERFFQVDASRSGHEGTGLGLAICRHIVEAHGGRIWAEPNTDGKGGRFLFTLLSAGEGQAEEKINERGEQDSGT